MSDDWRKFGRIIEETPDNVAWVLGALKDGLPENVKLVKKSDKQNGQPGYASRTQDTISYNPEPSLVLLDFDTKGMPQDVKEALNQCGGFLGAIESLLPEIAYVARKSTSSELYKLETGEQYTSEGIHAYALILDGTDAQRFLYALHERCWLMGWGWYLVGKSGALLERSIVDKMVCSAERLVFEASPTLNFPLAQGPRLATIRDGLPIDTRTACLDLDKSEQARVKRRKDTAKKILAPIAAAAKATFMEEKVAEAVARGISPETARLMAEQWSEHVLKPGAMLQFDDVDLGVVDVAEVLSNPGKFDGETLADPIEGISHGRCKAMFLWQGHFLGIHSFLDGGKWYKLEYNDPRPTIKIRPGTLPSMVDETEAAVIAAGRDLYQRGGKIVRIAEIGMLGFKEQKTIALGIVEQRDYALLVDASASAKYEKFSLQQDYWVPADPPMTVIRSWQAKNKSNLPMLTTVISTPLILPTGRVIEKPGLDEATGFYFNPLGTNFLPIPEKPKQSDALTALALLEGLIEEFPFDTEVDKSVALSGILTSVVRRALEFAFMHGITAPAYGSGKSFLVDLFSMIATGRAAPVITVSKSEEEFEKRLDAHLLAGVGNIAIDNVSRPLGGERLCQILTQNSAEIRPLGTSDKVLVELNAFITATGKNLTVVEDLRRRTLRCSIDAQEEQPYKRKFHTNPLEIVRADRGKFVIAALTIIQAFMDAGAPRLADPINNYGGYCAMVRDPLMWLGCADPCVSMESLQQDDPTLEIKRQIAAYWKAVFASGPKTAAQVTSEVAETMQGTGILKHPTFYEVLMGVAGKDKTLNSLKLGQWLGSNKNEVIMLDNVKHRFTVAESSGKKAICWKLEEAGAGDWGIKGICSPPKARKTEKNSSEQQHGLTPVSLKDGPARPPESPHPPNALVHDEERGEDERAEDLTDIEDDAGIIEEYEKAKTERPFGRLARG